MKNKNVFELFEFSIEAVAILLIFLVLSISINLYLLTKPEEENYCPEVIFTYLIENETKDSNSYNYLDEMEFLNEPKQTIKWGLLKE